MKSFNTYISEKLQNSTWEEVGSKEELTLEKIQNAIGHSSFMDDRSWGIIDDRTYEKLGKNKWQSHSNSAHGLPGTITDKELFDIVQNAQEVKFNLLVKE